MQVLLDERVDRRLKQAFAEGHEVRAVSEARWAGKKNGEPLRLAEREFDALVRKDKGIPRQQNLVRFDLAVVFLRARSNAIEDLLPLMDEVNAALGSIEPGTVVGVPRDR